jgi:hypothetical protein
MMKKTLVVIGVLIAGFLVFVATRPESYRVERSETIAAPADVVFAQLSDFRAWSAWSPWEKRDPAMKRSYDGPASGVGASYSWDGNKSVGKGKMTVTAVTAPSSLSVELQFIEPFASVAATTFTVKPAGDKVTATWAMEGKNSFMGKAFGVFMNMDKMIGGDFEKGLGSLKTVSEAEAARAAAAVAKEAAPAAPAAAAPAPAVATP